MYVVTAFLHREVEINVYMEILDGVAGVDRKTQHGSICCLLAIIWKASIE